MDKINQPVSQEDVLSPFRQKIAAYIEDGSYSEKVFDFFSLVLMLMGKNR